MARFNSLAAVGTLAAVLLVCGIQAANAVSDAEAVLFATNHLGKIQTPVRLVYAYRKAGSLEPAAADTVDLDIEPQPDGTKTVSANFLSGERKRNFTPVEHASGNPLLLYFLEHDIREMQRLTGGQPIHFQRRIRLALAGNPPIRRVSIQVDDREITAQEVTINPYLDDPARRRFEKFAGKSYAFTLCDQVPGGVYQIRTSIPGQGQALLEETLTFSRSEKREQ